MRTLTDLVNLIKYLPVAEKTIKLRTSGIYTFIVDRSMTKPEIKFAISNLFSVTIVSINTHTMPTKRKRVGRFTGKKPRFKKAYVKFENSNIVLHDLIQQVI